VKQQLCQLFQQLLRVSGANSTRQIERAETTNIDDLKQSLHAEQAKLVTTDIQLL